jgi:hypothetical protein
MTLACKWVKDRAGTGKIDMRWANENMSEKRRGDSEHNAPW